MLTLDASKRHPLALLKTWITRRRAPADTDFVYDQTLQRALAAFCNRDGAERDAVARAAATLEEIDRGVDEARRQARHAARAEQPSRTSRAGDPQVHTHAGWSR